MTDGEIRARREVEAQERQEEGRLRARTYVQELLDEIVEAQNRAAEQAARYSESLKDADDSILALQVGLAKIRQRLWDLAQIKRPLACGGLHCAECEPLTERALEVLALGSWTAPSDEEYEARLGRSFDGEYDEDASMPCGCYEYHTADCPLLRPPDEEFYSGEGEVPF